MRLRHVLPQGVKISVNTVRISSSNNLKQLSLRVALAIAVALSMLAATFAPAQVALAQSQGQQQQPAPIATPPSHRHDLYTPSTPSGAGAGGVTVQPSAGSIVERAMKAVCFERVGDPLGSVPIDEMQARPSLPLRNPDAVAGAQRAERLLPVAKERAIAAITKLAHEYKIEEWRIRAATRNIQAVTKVQPDVALRDNAAVILMDPRTVRFGTIFLAGLPSDEGMISVLAHELTHIADGREDNLAPLFRPIGRRAATLTGLTITGRRPEELTCDWVGALAARSYIESTPNKEPMPRRLARLVEHNCVDEDDTDEDHLSPLNTMRAVLALDPDLARDIVGEKSAPVATPTALPQTIGSLPSISPLSLTISNAPSYHHLFR
jgi:Zn-dependent protease with chaperone function